MSTIVIGAARAGRIASGVVRATMGVALRIAALTLFVSSVGRALPAQSTPVSSLARATRAQITARTQELQAQLADPKLKSAVRNAGLRELAALTERLEVGDFRVGDRFLFALRQDSIRVDSVTVRDSLNIRILNLPEVSLKGVLRSELDDKLSAHVARFLRGASVTTSLYTRIAVLGAVVRPGVYYVPPDQVVSDVVMLAGGPATDANLGELQIRRGGVTILSPKDSKRAIKDGRTLEQLDLQSGDEVTISTKKKVNWQVMTQLLLIASTLTFAVIQFIQFYYSQQPQ